MILNGKHVLFRLSAAGRAALSDLLPESGSFEALVVDQNSLGVWIEMPEQKAPVLEPVPVMLLKWDYFSTATVVFQREPELEAP